MASRKGTKPEDSFSRLREERKKFREVVEPIMCQQLAETIDDENNAAVAVGHADLRLLVIRGDDCIQIEKQAAAGTQFGLGNLSLPAEWFDGKRVMLACAANDHGQLTLLMSGIATPLRLELTSKDGTTEVLVLAPGVAGTTRIDPAKLATIDVLDS